MLKTFRAATKQVEACRVLGQSASIEPVVNGCSYAGFIVQLYDDRFERYVHRSAAVSAFIEVVEHRIRHQDFCNFYIHPASSEMDSSDAVKVVFSPTQRVLLSWT